MANGLIGGFGTFGQGQQQQGNLLGGVLQPQPTRGQRRAGLISNVIQQYSGNAQQTGGAAVGSLLGLAGRAAAEKFGLIDAPPEVQRSEAIRQVQQEAADKGLNIVDDPRGFGDFVAGRFQELGQPQLATRSLLQARQIESEFAPEPKERRLSVTGGSELADQMGSLYGVSIPEGETYEVGITGDRVTQINRLGASNVQNIDMGDSAESEFNERFARLDAETLSQAGEVGAEAVRNRGRLDRLEQLLKDSPQGFEGGVKQIAGRFGIATEGVDEIQATQALVNSIVPEQRPEGSGPMSDADLQFFIESFPRIINQKGGNEKIINTLRAINEYDAQAAEIVGRLRRDEIDRAEAFDQLRERENPLSSIQDDIDQGPYTVETPEGTFEFDTKGEADSFRREAGIE